MKWRGLISWTNSSTISIGNISGQFEINIVLQGLLSHYRPIGTIVFQYIRNILRKVADLLEDKVELFSEISYLDYAIAITCT